MCEKLNLDQMAIKYENERIASEKITQEYKDLAILRTQTRQNYNLILALCETK